jgi:pSer/pThr/pTyr-binding forkhead associated (FHA) protein
MPKLTLMRDRKTVQIYDLSQPVVRIGRAQGMDIRIDDVSVSRQQAEIQQEEGGGWVVRDIGSSNGTFVNGERLTGDRPLKPGDEIAVGQFSLFFERGLSSFQPRRWVTGEAAPAAAPAAAPRPAGPADATSYLSAEELERVRQEGAQKRQPHLVWEARGAPATHYLRTDGAALVGRSDLCDLRLPRGPRQHVLVIRSGEGFEVRNLSRWYRMRVRGQVTRRARLRDGDVIEVGGVRLTFKTGER